MSVEVIDLVSSSPSTGLPQRGSDAPRSNNTSQGFGNAATSFLEDVNTHGGPAKRARTGLPRDLFVFSDDSDTDRVVDEQPLPINVLRGSPANKRPRITAPVVPLTDHISAETKGDKSYRFFSNREPGRTKPSVEPIEISSSPDPHLPRNQTKNRVILSDSFTSSPHIALKGPPQKALQIVGQENDDPFASSPIPRTTLLSRHQPDNPVSGQRSPKGKLPDWDPISSSAPESQRINPFDSPKAKHPDYSKPGPDVVELSDGDDAYDLSAQSDSDIPDIGDIDIAAHKKKYPYGIAIGKKLARPKAAPRPATASTTSHVNSEARLKAREEKNARKEIDKEEKRKERERAKEAKVQEKARTAALAEVNKLKTDKKVSAREMIVDIPNGLDSITTLQLQTLLGELEVDYKAWESPVENVIKWRRKVASRFNNALGYWEPITPRIHEENVAMVVVTAEEFVQLSLGAEGENIESHMSKLRSHFSGQLLYMIEGLTPWMRKNRNIRNRQFTSAVRGQATEPPDPSVPSSQPNRRRKNAAPAQEYVSEDRIEDALLELQVLYNVFIHHTSVPLETAQWITIFTQHISTIPYRRQRDDSNAGAGFCMEAGQVRTGDDAKDTYVRMLQEISRVTAPIAYGIAVEFNSVTQLVRGLERDGPLTLENCRKSANKDGAASDRCIGQAISRRLHKVFTGRDESTTDV
jgi:crossover junction endonuclease EME1